MAVKASNQVSLVDITDAYSVMLTSEAFTFVGDTSGAPSGLSCTTQAVAYRGSTQCSEVIIGTITCPTGISAMIFNNGTKSPTIIFKTTATITDACEATIPVVVDGITINKKFSFAVAKTGSTGATGSAGKGVESTVVTYQAGSSGTTAPTGTWSSSVPATSASNPYLWTKTVITYTDGTTSTSYSVGVPPNSVVSKGDVVNQVNSELKVDGNSIALTTGHFTIDAANMKLDENGNAEFIGDVKAESFEFKDSLKMGFGQWGSSITLFDFSKPEHVDSSEDAYNVVIPNFSGTHIDNGTAFRNYIEGLDIQVPVTIATLNGRPYYPLPKEITEYRLVQPIYQNGNMVFGTLPLYRADLYTITSIYLLLPWDGSTGFNINHFTPIDKSTQGFCLISKNNDVIRWVKDTKGMIGKYLYVVYSATCTV